MHKAPSIVSASLAIVKPRAVDAATIIELDIIFGMWGILHMSKETLLSHLDLLYLESRSHHGERLEVIHVACCRVVDFITYLGNRHHCSVDE